MEKRWTRLDEKNEFLGSSNNLSAAVTRLINEISTLTDFEVKLPNIGREYQNKILELESVFNNKGLDIFGRELWQERSIITQDMLERLKSATEILEKKIKWLQSFFLLNQIKLFKAVSNRAIEWFLKDYVELTRTVSVYTIEQDFAKTIMKSLYRNNYDAMSPGSYRELWEKGRNILALFGLHDQIRAIGPDALALVDSQETASLEYYNSWNTHK